MNQEVPSVSFCHLYHPWSRVSRLHASRLHVNHHHCFHLCLPCPLSPHVRPFHH